MDFLSPIDGMNFNPISNYNNYLKGAKAFEVSDGGSDFESVLSQKTAELKNAPSAQGGIEFNSIADLMPASVDTAQTSNEDSPTGNFLDSLSKSVGGGLNSVNDKMDAANKAQEAFAMGDDSVSVHDVMISSEKAALSLQLAMQLRNKLTTAYNDINSIKV